MVDVDEATLVVATHRNWSARAVISLLLVAAPLALPGCSGSGSDNSGLPAFPYVANLQFPTAGPNPSNIEIVRAFPSLTFIQPTLLTHSPDNTNRLFVLELAGRIAVFPNDETTQVKDLFLDITAKVITGGEMGLLGMAFDPNYSSNGYFYLHYSAGNPQRSVISRFTVSNNDPNRADPNSEFILLEVNQPFSNHNSGMLAFGPDNMLYIGMGDGGGGGDPLDNGQDLGTLLGSMLRIDPHSQTGNLNYGIPADNPFVNTQGARGEIWAYGLRNPWRFSFDRNTGELWLGDVGQNAHEEIDVIQKGGNYGWPWYEGDFVYRAGAPMGNYIPPVYDYERSIARSITGGYVYRGSMATLRGAYVLADYATSRVWALVGGSSSPRSVDIGILGQVASFGEDQAGEVFLVSLAGTLHKFRERVAGPQPTFPVRLSETGLFVDTANMVADPNLLRYDVNEPLWSDDATKRRWVALPRNSRIGYSNTGSWQFPVGTVLVKQFDLPTTVGAPQTAVRLETRVLIHESQGWAGYVYRWNDAQTDADLLVGADTRTLTIQDPSAPGGTRQQVWNFPSRTNCLECHTSGYEVLGARTLQLNRAMHNRADLNQIDVWNRIGMLQTSPGIIANLRAYRSSRDATNTLEDRTRTYLAVNCAMCHRPGGTGGSSTMDLRYDTVLGQTNTLNVVPTAGGLGIPNPLLVRPSSKEGSVLWERMRRTDANRMPPLGTVLVDNDIVNVIGQWIDSLQ